MSPLTSAAVLAQPRTSSPLGGLEWAFSHADVDSIASLSASRIEISVLGKSRLYSRTQSRYVLKEFFDQYPPVRVSFSDPSTTEKGIFAAGTYRFASNREPLRLYVRLRRDGSSWALREIVIERAVR